MRKAEHEGRRLALGGEREQARGIGGEVLARDGLDAGREPPVGIARRDADGLAAEVEADQRAAGRADAAAASARGRINAGIGDG